MFYYNSENYEGRKITQCFACMRSCHLITPTHSYFTFINYSKLSIKIIMIQ